MGREVPVSKSHGSLSFLECCFKPSCEGDGILHKKFHQQFELHSVVRIFQIDHQRPHFFPSAGICRRHRMQIWLRFPRWVFPCSLSPLVWGWYVSPFQVLNKLPDHDPFHLLSRGVLHSEDTVSLQLAIVLSLFGDLIKVTMYPILRNLSCCEAFFIHSEEPALGIYWQVLGAWVFDLVDQQLFPCSVLKVFQRIPALWSGRHSSWPLSGFCPVLSRLLSFHPDCSDYSAGQSIGVVLSPFPSCIQYCSTGIYEVTGVGVGSAALDLSVELPEVSGICVSVEIVTEAFRLPVVCFTCHSVEHFCLFSHVRYNSQVWVWLASFFFATISPLSACQSTLPWLLCSTRVAGWRLSVVDLLCELACEIAALTSHPCLTYHTWTDIVVSVLTQSLISVDWRLRGSDHSRVMRGFLHSSMEQALGTPVPNWCLCHPVAYQCVCGLLLTQEWRGRH